MQLIRMLSRSAALCLICFPFAQASAEDVSEEDYARVLRARPDAGPLLNEIRRFEVERKNFDSRCAGYRQGSEYLQCQQERARLESWGTSLISRFKALQQADSVRQHSQTAARTRNAEAASREARYGFDTAATRKSSIDSSVVDARGLSKQDPVVPNDLKNDSVISKAVSQRDAARAANRRIDQELKTLNRNDKNDQVKIAKLRDERQRNDRQDQMANLSIKDQLTKLGR